MGETEETARAVNREPWEAPRGMVKLLCRRCDYYFAGRDGDEHCADCEIALSRRAAAQRS